MLLGRLAAPKHESLRLVVSYLQRSRSGVSKRSLRATEKQPHLVINLEH
jgi:hypothetical protein